MTLQEIAEDYLRREKAMKRERRGDFDPPAIVDEMIKEHGLTRQDIVRAVIDYTTTEPN